MEGCPPLLSGGHGGNRHMEDDGRQNDEPVTAGDGVPLEPVQTETGPGDMAALAATVLHYIRDEATSKSLFGG